MTTRNTNMKNLFEAEGFSDTDLKEANEFIASWDYEMVYGKMPWVQDTLEGMPEGGEKSEDAWIRSLVKSMYPSELLAWSEEDETKALDTDPDPSPKANASRLRRYWVRGPGAAKIGWGSDGDFNRCVAQLGKYVEDPKGLCNVYHRAALGAAPGQGHKQDTLFDLDEKRDVSQEERDDLANEGHALPDGSFPIKTREDLKNAIQAFGRAKDKDKARNHIKKRARALGCTDMLPDSWKAAMIPLELKDTIARSLDLADMSEEKGIRRVRTRAGSLWFRQPIGAVIVNDARLDNIRIGKPVFNDYDTVEGPDGSKYDLGKDEAGKWTAFHHDSDRVLVRAASEEALFEAVNKRVGRKGKRTGGGRQVEAAENTPRAMNLDVDPKKVNASMYRQGMDVSNLSDDEVQRLADEHETSPDHIRDLAKREQRRRAKEQKPTAKETISGAGRSVREAVKKPVENRRQREQERRLTEAAQRTAEARRAQQDRKKPASPREAPVDAYDGRFQNDEYGTNTGSGAAGSGTTVSVEDLVDLMSENGTTQQVARLKTDSDARKEYREFLKKQGINASLALIARAAKTVLPGD